MRPNPAATKRQFEILQGFIWHIYIIVRYKVNQHFGYYPESELDDVIENGVRYDSEVRLSRAWIVEHANRYNVDLAPIKNWVKTRVKNLLDIDVEVD